MSNKTILKNSKEVKELPSHLSPMHYFKFSDKSDITIFEDMSAEIYGSSESIAYTFWSIASKDGDLRSAHLYLFLGMLNHFKIIPDKEIDWYEENLKKKLDQLGICC